MAFDPLDIDGLNYNGLELRRGALGSVMGNGAASGARTGVRPGDPGLTVTLAGTTINVNSGFATIFQAGQGVYRAALPSSASPGTLTAAHATLTRIDLVYLRVWDNAVDSSGLTQGDVVYLAGTPAGSPVAPTPAGTQIYIPLATITVPPVGGGSASVSSAIRPITVAPGGILPSQTTTPSSPYAGQAWHDGTDLKMWNGTGVDTYAKVQNVGWTDLTPNSGFTTPQGAQQKAQGRLVTILGTQRVELRGSFTCTTDVTTQTNICTLPTAWKPTVLRTLPAARNYSASTLGVIRIEINNVTGILSVFASASPGQVSWFSMDGCFYDL